MSEHPAANEHPAVNEHPAANESPAANEPLLVAESLPERNPLPLFHRTVRPEWIDYNGHMSEAFYVLVFGYATDAMMIETGLHAGYRESTGCSLYTVEAHVRYLNDVAEGAHLAVRTRLLGTDAKKARFAHEMYVVEDEGTAPAPDAAPVATTELLALHVDQNAGRATPFPAAIRDRLTALTEPAPDWAGRAIAEVPRAVA